MVLHAAIPLAGFRGANCIPGAFPHQIGYSTIFCRAAATRPVESQAVPAEIMHGGYPSNGIWELDSGRILA